jgi:ATP-dependent DNA helicase RecQ
MTSSHAPQTLRPNGPTALARFADSPDEALDEIFGFDEFRPGQRDVVDRLLDGHDCLAVMPTGSGKSLCYQLTAAVTEGVTLVVSPLIALMKDQLDALHETGLPATEINSSMSRREQQDRIEGMRVGDYKIVYIAPERFRSPTFRRALEDVDIGLFAIDEAHCISQWGHDFRPDYRRLADVRRELGEPQTVALTATATEYVQKDIVRQLGCDEADIIVSGFERPNLYFEVFHARGKRDKLDRLEALIDYHDGESVIVYGATRKQVRKVRGALEDRGIGADLYHGGMDDAERADIHDKWMAGDVPVLVATNAFGMGVDKPDVRAVVHYNMPGSIEAYYQEAGRAGRDGDRAHCVLLFNYADTGIHEWFADNSYPTRGEITRVWEEFQRLGGGGETISSAADAIARRDGDLHPMLVESALRQLEAAEHIETTSEGLRQVDGVAADALRVDFDRLERRRELEKDQVENVAEYASSNGCRQAALLHHFGSEPSFGERCDHCSDCDPPPVYAEESADDLSETVVCSEDPSTVLRKVLSAIARGRGKRGATAVAGMLVGSEAKAVREAGFQQLSTYGILSEIRKKDATHLIDLCARHGLVRRNQYGCVLLTDRGKKVMRGASPPDSLADALERTVTDPSEATGSSSRRRSRSGSSGRGDTYKKTLDLHKKGLDVSEIADRRDLTERTISNHLITLASRGAPLELDVDADDLDELRRVAGDWEDGDRLRPVKDALPDDWGYPKLKRHLAAMLLKRRD